MNGRGLVLKYRPHGESDRLVTLFSREEGLRALLARGAAKPGSSLAGRVEPLTEIEYLAKPARGFSLLTQVRETLPFLRAKTTPAIRARAFVVLELVLRLYPEGRRDERAYDLTRDCLACLDRAETCEARADLALLWYKLNLLEHEGMALRPFVCGGCGAHHPATALTASGELRCPECLGRRGGTALGRAADLIARIRDLRPQRDGLPAAGANTRAIKPHVDRYFAAQTGLLLHAERLVPETAAARP